MNVVYRFVRVFFFFTTNGKPSSGVWQNMAAFFLCAIVRWALPDSADIL